MHIYKNRRPNKQVQIYKYYEPLAKKKCRRSGLIGEVLHEFDDEGGLETARHGVTEHLGAAVIRITLFAEGFFLAPHYFHQSAAVYVFIERVKRLADGPAVDFLHSQRHGDLAPAPPEVFHLVAGIGSGKAGIVDESRRFESRDYLSCLRRCEAPVGKLPENLARAVFGTVAHLAGALKSLLRRQLLF